jgi:hypothetical protein
MKKLTAVAALAAAAISVLVAVQVAGASGSQQATADPTSCQLGNGVKHVINIVFDNVHFFRDNPNVPSDLSRCPTCSTSSSRTGPCSRTRTPR